MDKTSIENDLKIFAKEDRSSRTLERFSSRRRGTIPADSKSLKQLELRNGSIKSNDSTHNQQDTLSRKMSKVLSNWGFLQALFMQEHNGEKPKAFDIYQLMITELNRIHSKISSSEDSKFTVIQYETERLIIKRDHLILETLDKQQELLELDETILKRKKYIHQMDTMLANGMPCEVLPIMNNNNLLPLPSITSFESVNSEAGDTDDCFEARNLGSSADDNLILEDRKFNPRRRSSLDQDLIINGLRDSRFNPSRRGSLDKMNQFRSLKEGQISETKATFTRSVDASLISHGKQYNDSRCKSFDIDGISEEKTFIINSKGVDRDGNMHDAVGNDNISNRRKSIEARATAIKDVSDATACLMDTILCFPSI